MFRLKVSRAENESSNEDNGREGEGDCQERGNRIATSKKSVLRVSRGERSSTRKEKAREKEREGEREAREQKYIKKRGLIKVQGKQRQEREREREGEGRASVIDEKRKREGKGRRRLRTAAAADAEEIATPCGVYWNEDGECLFS